MLSNLFSSAYLYSLIAHAPSIILGVLGIGFIIAIHECGHFIFGKLFNVNIPSFSIGFGPKILSSKIGETDFSISLIPIGGYVEAESGNYENPTPRSIAALPYWKKFIIMIGGICVNIAFSYIVFTILFFKGFPQNSLIPSSKEFFIESISPDSAAYKAGLQAQDIIVSIDNKPINNNLGTLLEYIHTHPNVSTSITVKRNNDLHTFDITLGQTEHKKNNIGMLGATFAFGSSDPLPFFASLQQAALLIKTITFYTFLGFKNSIKRKETKGFAGPLMMIKVAAQSASQGFELFIFLLAYISIGIAILNALPLPILDGGQIVTTTIESLTRRAISEKVLNIIHLACWVFMMGLFLLFTYQDILRMIA